MQIGCFTSPSIRGISEKQSFLVYFQLGIISWKKKKKKKRYWAYVDVVLIITLSIMATCLVSSNCSVTHVRWREGTSSVLFQWRPAFAALWRCGNSVVSVHHISNFWNTRSNLTKFSGQSPQWLRMVCAKLHVKRLRIDWDINEKRVKMMTKMPRDLWKRIVDSGFVAIVTVLAFLSFFVWRLLTSESDVKCQ